jgi:acid phosphatase (class A)
MNTRTISNKRCSLLLFAALLLRSITAPLCAQEPQYLTPGHPDAVQLLPPPPAAGSAEQAADLASTIAISKARSTNDEALAESEVKTSVFSFARVIGPYFSAERLPRTDAFFKSILKETKEVVDTSKDVWKRPRPYSVEPSLAVGKIEKDYSYPSGHSTCGTVFALLLAEILPEQREQILAHGRSIGWHRVQMGRHYPTDIYAGRTLGQAIVRELKRSSAFSRDLAEVKAEITAARQQREAGPSSSR